VLGISSHRLKRAAEERDAEFRRKALKAMSVDPKVRPAEKPPRNNSEGTSSPKDEKIDPRFLLERKKRTGPHPRTKEGKAITGARNSRTRGRNRLERGIVAVHLMVQKVR